MSPPRPKNQALAAILFLYKHVLEWKLGWLDDVIRARRSVHVPEVLSPGRVRTQTYFLESGSDIRTVAAPRLGHPASLYLLHPWSRAHPALAVLARPCTAQALLGHSDVKTTMIYTHVLQRGGCGVRSPLDRME